MPLREFRSHLHDMRISLSKVVNISFVGRDVVEFLVDETYAVDFLRRLQTFKFRSLPKFNPAVARDPQATPEIRKVVWDAFMARLFKIVETTTNERARLYFTATLDFHLEDSNTQVIQAL